MAKHCLQRRIATCTCRNTGTVTEQSLRRTDFIPFFCIVCIVYRSLHCFLFNNYYSEVAVKQWRQLERNATLRTQFYAFLQSSKKFANPNANENNNANPDANANLSSSLFEARADFTSPKFELMVEMLKSLPPSFLLNYTIHNGMTMFLRGAKNRAETYPPLLSTLFFFF